MTTVRTPSGSLLNSTYFTAETETDGSGEVSSLTIHGGGNGHGIGMCQWGADGLGKAGRTAPEIIRTYYPGSGLVRLRVAAD